MQKITPVSRKGLLALLILTLLLIPVSPRAAAETSKTTTLTFADSGIDETVSGSGYAIDGTTLTISAAGVYRITGSCSEGSIVVKGSLSDVVLILEDLTLKSSSTAPVVIKKNSSVTIHSEGTVNLYDNEDPANETSADTAVADAFEGAAIKVKSGSTVSFCGDGTLNVYGNAKNGIKGAATSTMVFADSGTIYNVTALNNGIAADGAITIYDGTFTIASENDGIKSVPEETDTESSGTITIFDGSFDIDAVGDGIQADTDLIIHGGQFTIDTFKGYNVSGTKYWNVSNGKNKDTAGTFDGDTMSCKGLKLSGDRGTDNEIYITGGTFVMNTSDDAVHSDKSVVITGGTFTIDSGDDGIHAEAALTLGSAEGLDRDPDITVNHSFEGLEAANEYIYSGRFYINAADDGINAAGGSDGDSTGFMPWGPGHGGSAASNYSLEIAGGNVYVNCLGDGLDSNGALKLTGGTITVFSMAANGDNSPIDADGTVTVKGATVFTAGSTGADGNLKASSFGQKYYQARQSVNANTVVNLYDGSSKLLYSDTLPRKISYWMYTSPTLSSNSVTMKTGGSVSSCSSNDWNHKWGSLTVVKEATESSSGIGRYTCSACGKTEDVTLLYDKTYTCGGHADTAVVTDEGYDVIFKCDNGVVGIDVYYTQDYTSASETDVTSTVSRDSDTGEPCSTGSGQVNFLIRLKDGCTLTSVTASEGTYKNIKGLTESGYENIFRITKITGNTTVTITTSVCAGGHNLTHADAMEATCTENGNIEHWYCTDCGKYFADENGTKELSAEDVILSANCPSSSFKDVDITKWYHEYIDYVVENGLMNGVAADQFNPQGTTTRGMIVTILYRSEGSPNVSGSNAFEDVESGRYYTDAVTWAAANGIVNGYSETAFGPEDNITREQFAAILYRYAQYKGLDTSASADLSKYSDADSISGWALQALQWANAEGLINGRSETELAPSGNATRAEAAAILMRFIEKA